MIQNSKGDFKVLSSAEPLTLGKNNYFISHQEISHENGSKSGHLVIKKMGSNSDGSPNGKPKQIFIPLNDAEKVLKQTSQFLLKLKF